MFENLIIDENKATVAAAKLHANHIGVEHYVMRPADDVKIVGELERYSIKRLWGSQATDLSQFEVRIVIGGIKIKLPGNHKLLVIDGVPTAP